MAHSPTPWTITGENGEYIIRSADDEWLSSKERFDHSAFDRKDAEFIVRAVNSHDDLLEALKQVMGWIRSWDPNFTQDDDWPETEHHVRAAISKAEEVLP